MTSNRKLFRAGWCLLFLAAVIHMIYVLFFSSENGRQFKCDTELFIHDAERNESLDAKFSLVMTPDGKALMDIVGTVKKEGTRYDVNRKIHFDYIDNKLKGFVFFTKQGEEGYQLDNSVANGAFNRLMFGDKQTLYATIHPLGHGAYEISDTLNPVLICKASAV